MIEIKNRFTGEVIHSGDFGTKKEAVIDAVERGVNLWDVDLSYVDLSYANLSYANLWGVNLEGTNLWDANLRDANLSNVNLSNVNLRDANLWGCSGNRSEIKSLFISDVYSITYTSERLQIGCENHAIADWWTFDDERIEEMDGSKAIEFWSEHKEFIKMAIEKYPATPTKE